MSSISALLRILRLLGPIGTIGLALRKFAKRRHYQAMLRVLANNGQASLKTSSQHGEWHAPADSIVGEAQKLLGGRDMFFSFPFELWSVERPWEYDPLEAKHWPRRHYTEAALHAADTPKDAKIVWEINRFVHLPMLGQAAILTGDKTYADEVERRILSWIGDNPFAETINWASALEISIRLLSWTTTLIALREAGFDVAASDAIRRSVFDQARYLAADLSTDKVVPTNHLIGEAAGLFVISMLWEFKRNRDYAERARRILEREIIRQTFEDGVTREASSWYHQFVTHFFDLADRVAKRAGQPLGQRILWPLEDMKTFLVSMMVDGELARYGDADDGWALWLSGDMNAWKDEMFGPAPPAALSSRDCYTPSQVVAAHADESFLFVRAGQFGMGGDGYASHAHDDFLSPIVWLSGLPVLVDPGTYVYNGQPEKRAQYRGANAHNGLVPAAGTGARQRMNFGWHRVRPSAQIIEVDFDAAIHVAGQYAEWPMHTRSITVGKHTATILDGFTSAFDGEMYWHYHLHPDWTLEEEGSGSCTFRTRSGKRLRVTLEGPFQMHRIESYDYSPSYRVSLPATLIHMTATSPQGAFTARFHIDD